MCWLPHLRPFRMIGELDLQNSLDTEVDIDEFHFSIENLFEGEKIIDLLLICDVIQELIVCRF
jgi:hypothetical protein